MKNITILGSTGSIGLNALKVIESNPEEYRVLALGAGRNIALLIDQIEEFNPVAVAVSEDNLAIEVRERINSNFNIEVLSGRE